MTSLSQIRSTLSSHKAEVAKLFGVKNHAAFGSNARNEKRANRDIDILVEFSEPLDIGFIELGDYLENILSVWVDLVSKDGIKPKYLQRIEPDLIFV